MTDFFDDQGVVIGIQFWPLPRPESMAGARSVLVQMLDRWQIRPTGDIKRILDEMGESQASLLSGDRGDMDLGNDAELDLDVRPALGSRPTTYVIVAGIWTSRRWYSDPKFRLAHISPATRPIDSSGATNSGHNN